MVIQDSPHRIAWGVAIGTVVAYLPIVGIQMVIGAIICYIMRANVLASIPYGLDYQSGDHRADLLSVICARRHLHRR